MGAGAIRREVGQELKPLMLGRVGRRWVCRYFVGAVSSGEHIVGCIFWRAYSGDCIVRRAYSGGCTFQRGMGQPLIHLKTRFGMGAGAFREGANAQHLDNDNVSIFRDV